MLKLVRNLIGDKKILRTPGIDKLAKWNHLIALHEQQEELGKRSGNRLTKIVLVMMIVVMKNIR